MVAIFIIMAAIAIVREEFSEKMDEVTSWGDPWEEPDCEVILDLAFDVE